MCRFCSFIDRHLSEVYTNYIHRLPTAFRRKFVAEDGRRTFLRNAEVILQAYMDTKASRVLRDSSLSFLREDHNHNKETRRIFHLVLSPIYALIYIIKILSQAVTLVALFTPTCFDPYGSSSGSTAGPC